MTMRSDAFLILTILIYVTMLLHLFVQSYQLVKYKHRLSSFQSCFIQLSFVWACLRFVYFLLGFTEYEWDKEWKQILVYWLPYAVQYSTFSLLVLFYASLVYRQTLWRSNRIVFLGLFIITNVVQYVFIAVWIGIGASNGRTRKLEQDINIYASIIYLFIAALIGLFGILVHRSPSGAYTQIMYRNPGYSWPVLTFLLFLSFLSRSGFNLYYSLNNESGDTFHKKAIRYDIDYSYFLISLWWELIPTTLVLAYFKIPNCAKIYRRHFKTTTQDLPPTVFLHVDESSSNDSYQTTQRRSSPINVFENPRRYDSDDETSERMSLISSAVDFTHSGPFDRRPAYVPAVPSSSIPEETGGFSTEPFLKKPSSVPN